MTKEERRAYDREWRKRNADKVREKQKKWYDSHPEYHKKWKEANREKVNQQSLECWYRHKEERLVKAREYKESHKEEMRAYQKAWVETHQEHIEEYRKSNQKRIRAESLKNAYCQYDKKYGKGNTTITTQWILDNIFTSHCIYCGESDWQKLGCDRKNNSKAHTVENVVCSCGDCNKKRKNKDILEFAYSIGAKDSEGLIIRA